MLSNDRLVLRRWSEKDRAAFAAMNSDPQVMEFYPHTLDRSQSDALIDQIERQFEEHGFGQWVVEVPGVARFIGYVGLSVPSLAAHFTPCVEIGWRLAAEHWGRGYATEAARLVLGHGFGSLALSEVVSFAPAINDRSRAVMERLGMRATRPMISTTRHGRRVIGCGRMCSIGSARPHISVCRDRRSLPDGRPHRAPLARFATAYLAKAGFPVYPRQM